MAYVHKDYEVEVEVEYTPPSVSTWAEICMDAGFGVERNINGGTLMSPGLVAGFGAPVMLSGFVAEINVSAGFGINRDILGGVPECNDG